MEDELQKYRAKKAKAYREGSWSAWKPSFSHLGTRILSNFSEEPNEQVLFRFILFLKLLLWILLWGFFIQIEFGTVFFFVSMFYWVYVSMQAGTRKPWEPSAYSVFNENCEAIDGTLNAEQFERELKFGAGAVSGKWYLTLIRVIMKQFNVDVVSGQKKALLGPISFLFILSSDQTICPCVSEKSSIHTGEVQMDTIHESKSKDGSN